MGTSRSPGVQDSRIKLGGIIEKRHLAKIGVMSIPDRPGVAGTIFRALGAAEVNCPFIVHTIDLKGGDNIELCVAQEDLAAALDALTAIKDTVGAEAIVHREDVGMVCIYGPHFGERAGIAGIMFPALATSGINILAISTSISSLCCVIDGNRMDEASRAIEGAFQRA
jgi:aspartate kinase